MRLTIVRRRLHFVAIAVVEEVVLTNGKIEQTAWSNSRGVVIVVFRLGITRRSRYFEKRRTILRRGAAGESYRQGRFLVAAEQASLNLLVCCQSSEIDGRSGVCGIGKRNGSGN